MLFQELWIFKADWDDDLPQYIVAKMHDWKKELIRFPRVPVPRQLMSGVTEPRNIQLHVFLDASRKAYVACAYLRRRQQWSYGYQSHYSQIKDSHIESSIVAATRPNGRIGTPLLTIRKLPDSGNLVALREGGAGLPTTLSSGPLSARPCSRIRRRSTGPAFGQLLTFEGYFIH
ncbi:hypothetical protein HPB50_004582 [Hyalomma asiaticum]|uniref:Uncharacterized protein n=1 Tax=Hyalomma asiaticum TaxID=266040 RepID=A0ACB7T8U2_HYAAI|nr:hypothetical protein HPB50_004582 [Hyalomma asiaticum]